MSEQKQSILNKFLGLLDKKKPVSQEYPFWLNLARSKDKEEFIRELEMDDYRLAYDKQHGLAAVHSSKPPSPLDEKIQINTFTRGMLGDLTALPTVAQAQANFEEHMIKVLPRHLEYKQESFKKLLSFHLHHIRTQRTHEKAGFHPARIERTSFVQSALQQRREHYLQQARVKEDIHEYKAQLQLKAILQRREESQSKRKGLGI